MLPKVKGREPIRFAAFTFISVKSVAVPYSLGTLSITQCPKNASSFATSLSARSIYSFAPFRSLSFKDCCASARSLFIRLSEATISVRRSSPCACCCERSACTPLRTPSARAERFISLSFTSRICAGSGPAGTGGAFVRAAGEAFADCGTYGGRAVLAGGLELAGTEAAGFAFADGAFATGNVADCEAVLAVSAG